MTAITTKTGQSLVDIVSTRMLGQYGFLAKVPRSKLDRKKMTGGPLSHTHHHHTAPVPRAPCPVMWLLLVRSPRRPQ